MLNTIKNIIGGKKSYMESVKDIYEDVTIDSYVDDVLLYEKGDLDIEEDEEDEVVNPEVEDDSVDTIELDDETSETEAPVQEVELEEPKSDESSDDEVDILNVTLEPEDEIITQDDADAIVTSEINLQTDTLVDTVPNEPVAAVIDDEKVIDSEGDVVEDDVSVDDISLEDPLSDEDSKTAIDNVETESANEFERPQVYDEAISVDGSDGNAKPDEKKDETTETSEDVPAEEVNDVTAAVIDKIDESEPEEDVDPEAAVEKESILDKLNRINAEIKEVKQTLSN